ncbi:MAG: hypothetical protein AABO58_09625 [Acidobacteriota bacterium]
MRLQNVRRSVPDLARQGEKRDPIDPEEPETLSELERSAERQAQIRDPEERLAYERAQDEASCDERPEKRRVSIHQPPQAPEAKAGEGETHQVQDREEHALYGDLTMDGGKERAPLAAALFSNAEKRSEFYCFELAMLVRMPTLAPLLEK